VPKNSIFGGLLSERSQAPRRGGASSGLQALFAYFFRPGEKVRKKDLRTSKKLTQTDLAKMVGLTYIQIGRNETGKSAPSADELNKMADASAEKLDLEDTGYCPGFPFHYKDIYFPVTFFPVKKSNQKRPDGQNLPAGRLAQTRLKTFHFSLLVFHCFNF